MRTLAELRNLTGLNVLSAFFYNNKSYRLLIEKDGGYFFSHYIEGQFINQIWKELDPQKGNYLIKKGRCLEGTLNLKPHAN